MKTILVTGSSGLIGSEVCTFFHNIGYKVYGLDNNQRSVFFWPSRRYSLESKKTREKS